ncbi:MAG: 3,4-dihydroxyphenylacetate 2,3-dioxygenase [Dehalococcoidia bacterium]
MGELVLAAKVSHVPSIYLGEQPGPNQGIRASLREGLKQLGARAREAGVETFVVFDVHWINTIGFHINSAERHRGVFTSHELPHFIHDLPYDYRGDKALAELIADEVNGGGLRMMAHDLDTLTLEYATLLPMRYMNPAGSARVVPIGSNSNASMEENRRVGEAVRRAIERSDRRVGVLASGSLSHAFWANEKSSLPGALSQVSSDFNRQNDVHVLDLWKSGRTEEFLRFLPVYLKVCEGEINMSDTAALFGVLGWDAYRGDGIQYGDYEGSSGTGQAIVEFPVTPAPAGARRGANA